MSVADVVFCLYCIATLESGDYQHPSPGPGTVLEMIANVFHARRQ
jgi:hypothetical protein